MFPRARTLLGIFALLAATLLVYWPTLQAGFIWNDADYVTAPELRTAHGLARIWFEIGATEQYYPLLHSAFWLEHKLWGDTPAGYHLLNVLLHAGSACLLAACLGRLAFPGAWLAAFLFALHPIGVESVAWISEQKNTLSLFFYLAAALAYLAFDASRQPRTYALASAAFLAALLSKTTTATLPPALLVIFWWRRGRLDWRRDVWPLLPWFAAAAAMGLLSAWVERRVIGADGAEFALSFPQRAVLAGRIVWFYLGKLFWPGELVFIYPRWQIDAGQVWQWGFSTGVLVTLAALWRWRHQDRAPLAAALFFGGSLFPVLGFFNVYGFLFSYVADHWQYLPSLGIIVLAAGALTRLLAGRPPLLKLGLPVALVTALAAVSHPLTRTYRDMETFYRATLARNPDAWMAHNNLGNVLRESGRFAEAVPHFEAAMRLRPDMPKAPYNLANCLRDLKRPAEAIALYQQAIRNDPGHADAHNNLGRSLRELGRASEALAPGLEAVRLDPASEDARNNLGMTLRELGRLPEATSQFEQGLRLHPDSVPLRLNLSLTLSLLGREVEADAHYREARRRNPNLPDLAR
ncbi:MAG: tetratricopeptide repeat protein [Verrucomicrobia bacterium]|nr:tetratricopeptide repeat protein [Verrucomicrobiota bacterium]